jgi:hypothetical protein
MSGGPEVETNIVPSEFLESTKPDIRASAPEGDRKCACNGTRSVSNLLNRASASFSEIWGMAASLLYASDSEAVQRSGKDEPLFQLNPHRRRGFLTKNKKTSSVRKLNKKPVRIVNT